MIEREVVVTTKHGHMPCFAACPDGTAPVAPVIFYMDAPGIREELRHMARRIAARGYYCLLPDMYYRLGTIRLDMHRRDDGMTAVIMASMAHLTNQLVVEDTAGMLAFLDGQDRVKPGPVGCVGHCMSGKFITTVAGRFPHRIAAAASLYGVGIVTEAEDSPHKLLPQVKGELYYAFAEHDAHVPAATIPALRQALGDSGAAHVLEVFPGTQHGFCFPERAAYDTLAAEATWAALFAMYERRLR